MDAAGDATVADVVVAVSPGYVEVVVLVGWWWYWVRPVMTRMLVLVGVRKIRKAKSVKGRVFLFFLFHRSCNQATCLYISLLLLVLVLVLLYLPVEEHSF
jgi:hypothetical protein